ncbi:hypothetical protein Tco_0811310 [Tanacetum coccineum]
MSNSRPNPQAPQNSNDFDHGTLAILLVGNGCTETAPRGLKEGEVRNHGRGLFHKVDRSQAAGQDDREGSKEVPISFAAEIGMPMHRTMTIKEGEGNEEEMRLNLDVLQERREAAAIREAIYKMKMKHYYNKRVRPMSFKVGEYVCRKNEASRVENLRKLGPKWEGPYLVVEAYQNGSYKLQTMDDREVPRVWHAINLRKCYL